MYASNKNLCAVFLLENVGILNLCGRCRDIEFVWEVSGYVIVCGRCRDIELCAGGVGILNCVWEVSRY